MFIKFPARVFHFFSSASFAIPMFLELFQRDNEILVHKTKVVAWTVMICMTVGRPENRKRPAVVGAWNQINESMHQTSWTLLHLNASHAFHECLISSKHNRTSRVRGGQRASASRVRSSKHKELNQKFRKRSSSLLSKDQEAFSLPFCFLESSAMLW